MSDIRLEPKTIEVQNRAEIKKESCVQDPPAKYIVVALASTQFHLAYRLHKIVIR